VTDQVVESRRNEDIFAHQQKTRMISKIKATCRCSREEDNFWQKCLRVQISRYHNLQQVIVIQASVMNRECQLPTAVLHIRRFSGTFRSHAFRIPDEEYGRALDCLVKACCDVIVTVVDEPCAARSSLQEKIFLGRRQVEPQPDWWFIGGRM
jgi:hypothetical protein